MINTYVQLTHGSGAAHCRELDMVHETKKGKTYKNYS